MPTYTFYRGRKKFTEFMHISEMEELEKDPEVRFEIAAPQVLGPGVLSTYKKGDQFRKNTIEPIIDKLNPNRTKLDA